jgi:hypothetical protein
MFLQSTHVTVLAACAPPVAVMGADDPQTTNAVGGAASTGKPPIPDVSSILAAELASGR